MIPEGRVPQGSEQEALLYVWQLVAGLVMSLAVSAVITSPLVREPLSMFVLFAAGYPFARRTWAADVPAWRFFGGVLIVVVFALAFRLAVE